MSKVVYLVSALPKLAVLLLILFVPFLVLASCVALVEGDHSAAATGEPTALECEDLSDDERHLCSELVAMRASDYEIFLESYQAQLEPVQLTSTEARVNEAIALTPQMLANRELHTEVICEVRDIGRVDCISLASLLAIYDAEMGELILSDISRLYEVFEFDPTYELLFACGPGLWGAADLTQFGSPDIAGLPELVVAEAANQMMDMCGKFGASMGDGASSLANAGGFSGVTGFDPLGLGSICGMEISGGPGSFGRVVDQFVQMSEALRASCETTLGDTLKEGGTDSASQQAQNPPTQTCIGPSEDAEAMRKETTEGTNQEGERITTTTTVYSDNTTVKKTKNHATGVTTTVVTFTDVGSSDTTVNDPNDKGGPSSTCSCSDAPGVETKVYDGDPDTSITRDNYGWSEEGNRHDQWVETDRSILYTDRFGNSYFWDKVNQEGTWVEGGPGELVSCVDEVCQTCVDYAAFNPRMMDDCLQSGGASYSCEAFSREADCCSNPDAFPSDPRLVIPNPEGDFVCMGGADPDLEAEACETMCSVAEREDCYSNCVSRGLAVLDISPLDLVCRYAMSEACFSSQGGIPVPEHQGPWIGGPEPIPQPDVALAGVAVEHLVLPPIEPRRPGGEMDH